jgi:serine/threonine protein kinase
MTATGDAAIGSRFGRYRIEALIGKGGMARVYRATLDGPLGFARSVAIKQIRADTDAHSDKLVHALVNEARLGARLNHPNVVDVLEFGRDDGAFFIVMELVDGRPLSDVISRCAERGSRLPLKLTLQILVDVASGVAHAHSLVDDEGQEVGLIHRDLKPANILLSRSGQAMVADFGLAKSDANLFQSTSVEVKGTPSYMSPEQVACRALTPASDLFSLGSILYEMLRGEPLFMADNMLAIVHKVAQVPMDHERFWVRQNVPLVSDLFERLIDKDPENRPTSAAQVVREASELLRGFPAEVTLADLMRWLDDEAGSRDSMPCSGDYAAPQPSGSGPDPVDSRGSTEADSLGDTAGTTMDMETRIYRAEAEDGGEPTVAAPTRRPAFSRPVAGLAAALIVVVVAVGIGWTVGRGGRPDDADAPDIEAAGTVAPDPGEPTPAAVLVPDPKALVALGVDARKDPTPAAARLDAAAPQGADGTTIEPPTSAPAETADAPAALSTVTIDCNPWCDAIHVDGEPWGESMLFQRPITVGSHEVRLHESRGSEKILVVDVAAVGSKVCWDFDRGAPCGGT